MDDIDIDLGSVIGAQGPEGKTLYLGEGEPSDELGSSGCTYMDTATGQIYQKEDDQWAEKVQVSIGSIIVDPSLDPDSLHAVRNSAIAAKFAEVATALAGKQSALTFDDSPAADSPNPVKSGGVYTALAAKQDAITDTDWVKCDGTSRLNDYTRIRRIGNVVYFRAFLNNGAAVVDYTNTTDAFYTPNFRIPEGFRPVADVQPVPIRCWLSNGGTSVFGSGVIRTDGTWIPLHKCSEQAISTATRLYAVMGYCWATWTVD